MKLKPRLPEALLSRFTIPKLKLRLKGEVYRLRHTEGDKTLKGVEAKIRIEQILNEKIRLKEGKRLTVRRLAAKRVWLTQSKLQEHIWYDPNTGIFIKKRTGCQYPWQEENYQFDVLNPTIRIRIGKFTYHAHELALFYMTGEWSKGCVYFVDGNFKNFKFDNLMSVIRSEMQKINLYRNSSGWNTMGDFDFIKNNIRYDPLEGRFYYSKTRLEENNFVGPEGPETEFDIYTENAPACFQNSRGYRSVKIQRGNYVHAHILAWFLHYGERPSTRLTWINGDKTDNRVANLFDPLIKNTHV